MNSKKQMFVFLVIMVFVMTLIISFAGTVVNFGFNDVFLFTWLKSWVFAFVLALPIAMFLAPTIRKWVSAKVK